MAKKIILADDNRTYLMYAGLLLKRFGFQVIPAENGLEVLKLIRLTGPDLVMLDVHMAPMDGITLLRHIKQHKTISYIPVIMVTVDASEETRETCLQHGCFDYMLKPLKVDKVYDSLQRCFFGHMGTNRKHVRTYFNKKVMLECNGQTYELFSETLSEGGIYLRKEEPFPEGTNVTVTLSLPNANQLTLKGVVIYQKSLFGDFFTFPPGMAIQFKDLSEQQVLSLKQHVENLIAADIIESGGTGSISR